LIDAVACTFKPTAPAAEVEYGLAKRRTNRDMVGIFGTCRTSVKKRLEPVFEKQGLQTHNAATSRAAS
jgi:hypothetical protein